MMQSLLPAMYPMLKSSYRLSFGQIGLLTFTYPDHRLAAAADHRCLHRPQPKPYSLAVGMGFTLFGLLLLAFAGSYRAAAGRRRPGRHRLHGVPSRILARGAHGLGRPARAGAVDVPGRRQCRLRARPAARRLHRAAARPVERRLVLGSLRCWACSCCCNVGHWYKAHGIARLKPRAAAHARTGAAAPARGTAAIAVLLALIFTKYFYLASLTSYYTFYLIEHFHVSVRSAQMHLFLFLAAVAVGSIIGGPLGDRFGRKYVIWVSILGVLPFTLLLPYANLFWTGVLTVPIGLILAFGLSGHRGVCAGAACREDRHGRGTVLRLRVRHGRHRRGGAGRARRRHQHRVSTRSAPSCR